MSRKSSDVSIKLGYSKTVAGRVAKPENKKIGRNSRKIRGEDQRNGA
jgi:hypothetical protein